MAIPIPKSAADLNFITSTYQCTYLIQALKHNIDLDLAFHQQTMCTIRQEYISQKYNITSTISHSLEKENLPTKKFTRCLKYLQEPGISY